MRISTGSLTPVRALLACLVLGGIDIASAADCVDLSRPICMQQALERSDRDLNAIYSRLVASFGDSRAEELRVSQRAWVADRNRLCKLSHSEMVANDWIAVLSRDSKRSLCVYGSTTARVEELRKIPVVISGNDAQLLDVNDVSSEVTRSTGKWYAEFEFVAKNYDKDGTRYMQVGLMSAERAFSGMQLPGADMAADATEMGVYTVGIAMDLDGGRWYWSKNGAWQNGAPGATAGTLVQGAGHQALRLMSLSRTISNDLDRGFIRINTGQTPFNHEMPAGFRPFYAPAKTSAGDAVIDWIVPSYRKVANKTLGQWGLGYWAWLMSKKPDRNPTLDTTGERCAEDQVGPVWFLAGGDVKSHITRECRVPRGKFILIPAVVQLWFVKSPTETESACAQIEAKQFGKLGAEAIRDAFVTIDGERFDNFIDRRPFSIRCAPLIGPKGETITNGAMQYGAWMLLQPLPPGEHVVSFGGSIPELNTFRGVTYRLQVQ